ncbi:MAG: transcriptional regulator [Hyphobacterium sp.]|nr:MAG: transcriptional regulator [Hyphobacterium sp.]
MENRHAVTDRDVVKHLIKRLARIDASDGWRADLNPAQRAALDYLSRANRFSRQPSHLASYLGSTRGTVSQTLKSLAAKGYVEAVTPGSDKRTIAYQLTESGRKLATTSDLLSESLDQLSAGSLRDIATQLRHVLGAAIHTNRQKPFGLCKDCTYFQPKNGNGHCRLLNEELGVFERDQICHEQLPRSAGASATSA